MSLVFIFLAFCIFSASAQTSKLFQWQFSNNFLGTSLPSCLSLPITVKLFDPANDTSALFGPPFYMIAFEVGGTPRTTLLGENATSLSWLVDHPVGTQLMLNVVDANGSAGGIPPQLYTVTSGQTTQCIKPSTASDFTVTANVTDVITTCQPWGLRIKGGAPPYNLTLAALNSPIVTNVTLLGAADAFTYIDRADPNTQLLAGISDLTGRWASGTPIVRTQGSTDVNCTGLVSSPGNSTQLAQEEAAAAAAKRKHRTSIVAGVTVPLVILLLAAGGGFGWWYLRRRQMKIEGFAPDKQLDLSVKPFEVEESRPASGTEGQVLSINSWVDTGSASPKYMQTLKYSNSTSAIDTAGSTRPDSSSSSSRPGFAAFPVTKVRHAKSLEASELRHGYSPSESSSQPPLGTNGESQEGGVREVVIQHRDGGDAVVRELPPPYADRTGEQP